MHYTGQMEVAFCTDLNWFDWYRLLFYSDWVSWHLAGVCAVYKFPLWYIVCTVLKCAKLPPLYPPLHQLRVTGGSVQLWEKAKGIGRSVNTTCRRCIALSCSIFGATAISWMRNGNMRLLRLHCIMLLPWTKHFLRIEWDQGSNKPLSKERTKKHQKVPKGTKKAFGWMKSCSLQM